jgi:hypothetical protein
MLEGGSKYAGGMLLQQQALSCGGILAAPVVYVSRWPAHGGCVETVTVVNGPASGAVWRATAESADMLWHVFVVIHIYMIEPTQLSMPHTQHIPYIHI